VNTRLPPVASTPDQFGRSVRATALVSPLTGSSALMLPVVCSKGLPEPPVNRSRAARAALIGEIHLHLAFQLIATLARRDVDQVQFGIISPRLPVLAAGRRRTPRRHRIGACRVAPLHVGLHVLRRIVLERPAGFRVEALVQVN